ncbi:MAG: VOC family protein [candidate division Zixibacteria bacterium]|nr:VOC family protein [candidate division Zixibacteria bacterium]
MPYKFSRCLCLESPDSEAMITFYRDVLGLPLVHQHPESAEFNAHPTRLFIDNRPSRNVIMEFLVPDLEEARVELTEYGCREVRWEGKGGCCYLVDPFGFIFNLYEEPRAFE